MVGFWGNEFVGLTVHPIDITLKRVDKTKKIEHI